MRRIVTLAGSAVLFAALALAESWTGRLVDSNCMDQQTDQQKSATACMATSSTTTFAIDVNGKVYRLDDGGNAKAARALKDRADRTDPNGPPSPAVIAKVSGTREGDIVKVEAIEVQ
jgi:hypothetical protein